MSPQIILSSGRGASPPFRRISRSNAEKSARSRRSAKKAAVFMAACFSETAVATNSSPGNRIVGLCRQHQCRTTTALFVMNERRIKVDPDEIAGFGTILRLPVTRLRANAPVDFVMTVLRRNAPDELVEGVAPLAALWFNRFDHQLAACTLISAALPSRAPISCATTFIDQKPRHRPVSRIAARLRSGTSPGSSGADIRCRPKEGTRDNRCQSAKPRTTAFGLPRRVITDGLTCAA